MAKTKEAVMSKDEFCQRFISRMVELVGENFEDGSSIRGYAEQAAPTYWEDQHQNHGDSPEECAENDVSYWEMDGE